MKYLAQKLGFQGRTLEFPFTGAIVEFAAPRADHNKMFTEWFRAVRFDVLFIDWN